MHRDDIKISDYDYPLPEERIARFPLERRDMSKLLINKNENISESVFSGIGDFLPAGSFLVFNNTKVIRARLVLHKESGARIEVFCLEPHDPADYERAFAVRGECRWHCMVGNLKKWKEGPLSMPFEWQGATCRLEAIREEAYEGGHIVRFSWDAEVTFGQLLEILGRIPIPPYLGRESEEIDLSRYQTVYSRWEGSVAAPTAGLHFSEELIERLRDEGFGFGEVTLHVGAGTFLPVKADAVADHRMHIEHFEVRAGLLEELIARLGSVIAVGTTTVRTLESLTALGYRVLVSGTPDAARPVGQWECYDIPAACSTREILTALKDYMVARGLDSLKASTQIMIMPGYGFRLVSGMVTNFHQPCSTLLLLVSAFVGDTWRTIYDYALARDFRFLSYGDSMLLLR